MEIERLPKIQLTGQRGRESPDPFYMFNPVMANYIRSLPETQWQQLHTDYLQQQMHANRQSASHHDATHGACAQAQPRDR